MSKVHMVRALVNQRLTAAAEEIFGLFERTIAEHEEELCRLKEKNEQQQKLLDAVLKPEVRLHRAVLPSDVHKVIVGEEGQQEWSPSLDQEDPPEPPHIKEEQEELWTSQEGEQLQGLEEADITKFLFTPVPVKSEDDEEKPQSSQLHQRQTEQMETGADGEDCGGPEPARNSHPDPHLQPVSEDEIDNFSVADVEVSDDDRKDTSEPLPDKLPFGCTVCSRRFTDLITLESHMRNHNKGKRFSCRVCDQRFALGCHLKRHSRFCHQSQPVTEERNQALETLSDSNLMNDNERNSVVNLSQIKNLKAYVTIHQGKRPFGCSVCYSRFTQKGGATAHMAIHTGEKRFSCSVCDQRFTLRHQLTRHKCVGPQSSQLHPTEQNREAEPGASSSTEQMETGADGEDCGGPEPARNSHPDPHLQPETVKTGVICSECGRRFKNKGSLRLHMTSHKPFSCSVCSERFFLPKQLKRHMLIHPKEKPFSCSFCGIRFTHKVSLTNHTRIHTGNMRFSCRVCNKGFIWRHQRAKHMCPGPQSSQLRRKTRADGERFTSYSQLKDHSCESRRSSRLYQNQAEAYRLAALQASSSTEDGHLAFGTEDDDYSNRKRETQSSLEYESSESGMSFSCSQCGRIFSRIRHLKIHMKRHGTFICMCGLRFPGKSQLKRHKAMHRGDKGYICLVCRRKCLSLKSFKKHMRTHEENPFSCRECGERFSSIKNRTRHRRTHLTFGCSVCGMRYEQEEKLKRHMAIHQKQFNCNVCDKRFTSRYRLTKHKLVCPQSSQLHQHQIEENKEVQSRGSSFKRDTRCNTKIHSKLGCPYCGKTFAGKGPSKEHMAMHTREKRFYCNVCEQGFTFRHQVRKHKCILYQFSELYHNQTEENREEDPGASSSTEQLHSKEEVPPEQQEWSPSLDQEDPPEPPHIKEEQEELWTSQEGEQLQGLEEADITKFLLTPVPVKSEDDEEKPQSSQLHQRQTEQMETGADGEDCGGPEPARKIRRRLRCSLCSKTFTTRKRLKKHMNIHPKEKPLSCAVCAKRFTHLITLKRHMVVIHTGEIRFRCRVCDQGFFWRQDLAKHKCPGPQTSQLHQRQTEQMQTGADGEDCGGPEPARNSHPDTYLQPVSEDEIDNVSVAESSEKRFASYSQLKDHSCESRRSSRLYQNQAEAYRLAALQASSSTEDDDYSNRKRETQSSLEHETSESGMSFSCSECGKILSSIRHLKNHMKIHGPFICSMCGLRFHGKSQLKRHEAMHRGDIGYICLVCRGKFDRLKSFKEHMRTHEENPFNCRVCDKIFTSRYRLIKHKRLSVCSQSSQLHQHQIEENKEVRSRGSSFKRDTRCNTTIYSKLGCPYCGKTFAGKGPSKEHMAMHTREKRFYCNVCEQGFTFRHQLGKHKCEENREEDPGASSSTEQLHSKEEVPPEQQEWSPSLDQEDPPEPPHIKEEQEELWTSQEGEQLQGLEEIDITKFLFTPVPVKSEDDEEKPQSSQLHQRQTEQMETGADGEDCGGPEPARNSYSDF